jgi:hypothetical protein
VSKTNAVLGALLDAKVRHQQLVDAGEDSASAWLKAGGQAAATLGANLKGGTLANVVNGFNSFEQALKTGQDPGEALATAFGTVGGGAIANKVAKPSIAGLVVEGVNTGAQLLGAPEPVQLATSGAVEVLPSTVVTRTITAGARSLYALGEAALRGDASGLDRLVTDFKKGGAGPALQGYTQWLDIITDVASGTRTFEQALNKAGQEGKGSWADKAGGGLGEAFADLGQNEKALRGDYTPIVQGWAQLSRVGQELVRGKSVMEAIEVAGSHGGPGAFGGAIGDAAYSAYEKTSEIINEDIPKIKQAVAQKATQVRDNVVALKNKAVEAAGELKEDVVALKDRAISAAIEYKDKAVDVATDAASRAYDAVTNPGETYDAVKNRLAKAFRW